MPRAWFQGSKIVGGYTSTLWSRVLASGALLLDAGPETRAIAEVEAANDFRSEAHEERVARVTANAEETFASKEKAHRWLCRPTTTLDGEEPLKMLDTEAGA